jgi:hypothetical protein
MREESRLDRHESVFTVDRFPSRLTTVDVFVDRFPFRFTTVDVFVDRFPFRFATVDVFADRFPFRLTTVDVFVDRFPSPSTRVDVHGWSGVWSNAPRGNCRRELDFSTLRPRPPRRRTRLGREVSMVRASPRRHG